MRLQRLVVALAVCLPLLASAEDKKSQTKAKVKAPMFEMPSLGEIPKAEGMTEKKVAPIQGLSKATTNDPTYQVLSVVHAAGFTASPEGPQPIGNAMEAVDVRGKPLSTERFSTLLTVKSPQRTGAPIDVAILDTRGDTVLSATGELSWVDAKSDSALYQIDWDPSPVRGPGEYQVLVRIAGKPMGTWPLKVRNDPARAR